MNKKDFLSLGLVFLAILLFFRGFFIQGRVPIPTDTLVNLFHPFRDYYAKDYPRGIPYKNFLLSDPVTQQIPWKSLSISQMSKGQLPLWNPYQMAGYPLLGNIQSSPFYPLNILLFVSPFIFSWSIFILLQQILAAFFMYLFLRNLKLERLSASLGSLSFVFCGFFIAWLEWGTIVHTALWLPLILLCVDKILSDKRYRWSGIFIFAVLSSFLAGHLQTFIYSTGVVIFYFIYRLWGSKYDKKFFLRTLGSVLIALMMSLPILIPQLQLISLSARNLDQNWHQQGWFIPISQAIQFIAPDFFGNPATGNYFGVWNYGEFIGYIGIFPLLLVFFAVLRRKNTDIYFWTALAVMSVLFAFQTPLAKLPYVLNVPFLSSTQPTRLIFVTDFALSVLAAFGLERLLKTKTKVFLPQVILFLFLVLAVGFGFMQRQSGQISPINWQVTTHNLILPALLVVLTCIGLFVSSLLSAKRRTIVIIVLFFMTMGDLLIFAGKFTPFANPFYFYPTTKVIAFLKNQPGQFRIMTTDRRILHPNIATQFRLQSIDGYDPLYLLQYGEMMAAVGRGKPDIIPPFGYFRILAPGNFDSPLIDLLGVRYVLSLTEIHSPHMKQVFLEGETRVYENKRAFPRAFFVTSLFSAVDNQQAIDFLFDPSTDLHNAAVVQAGQSELPNKFSTGDVTIDSYSENTIILTARTDGEAFMVLTDTFYRTWKATVDGKQTPIYRTDYNFRGVIVPKGEHRVEFKDNLF